MLYPHIIIHKLSHMLRTTLGDKARHYNRAIKPQQYKSVAGSLRLLYTLVTYCDVKT